MKRKVNVRPLSGIKSERRYNVRSKKNVRMLEPYAGLNPRKGTYRVGRKLANHLFKKGKAVEVKQDKTFFETKEEKHAPAETKAYISVKQLASIIMTLSDKELQELLKDERITARKLAQDEIARRENTSVS